MDPMQQDIYKYSSRFTDPHAGSIYLSGSTGVKRVMSHVIRSWSLCGSLAHRLRWIPVASVVGLMACYPRPHEFYRSQDFTGKLTIGAAPVTHATVLISNSRGDKGRYCDNVVATGMTDGAGKFHILPVKESHLFDSLLNPPASVLQTSAVCFRLNTHETLGAIIISHTDREMSYTLSCDLDAAPQSFKQGFVLPPDQWGVCTNAN